MRYFLSAIAGVVTSFYFPLYSEAGINFINIGILFGITTTIISIAMWMRRTMWKPLIKVLNAIFIIELIIAFLGMLWVMNFGLDKTYPVAMGLVLLYAVIISIFIGRTIHFIGEKMEQVKSI